MKILRKILVFILGVILSLLIGVLLLSFVVKTVIQEELVGGAIKDNFVPMITDNAEISAEDKEKVKEILEDKEVNELVNNMVEEILITMGTGEGEISQDTINSIFDYVIENKDKLESVTGQEINVEEIEKLKNSEEFKTMSKELTEAVNESSTSLDDNSRTAIKTYTYIISDTFRLIILGGIILDLILIALIQWSLYNWLSTLGKALTTSGVTLIILYFGMNVVLNSILKTSDINLSVDTTSVLIMGIVCIVVGIVLIVIRRLINNYVTEQKEKTQEIAYNAVS